MSDLTLYAGSPGFGEGAPLRAHCTRLANAESERKRMSPNVDLRPKESDGVGLRVGACVGVGRAVGEGVGRCVGVAVGCSVGCGVGGGVGRRVGLAVGCRVG